MIAFEENLIGLLESVEDCLAKRRILPCLMLLYSGIDVIASLETGKASRSVFIRWVNKYLLKAASLSCTALAGCGKSLNRDDSPPQGLKPSLILHDLRGAKAPLYHSAAGFRDFFRSLLDLYGARCGILHTFSAKSDMSAQGQAREIVYAWGNAKAADLAETSKVLGRNDCVLHLRELINAFRVGLADSLEEVMKDDKRKQKLEAGAGLWFTHLDQETVKTFLKAARIAE